MDGVVEVDAEQVAGLAAHQPRARRIGGAHPAAAVQHEDGVVDAPEQRREQVGHGAGAARAQPVVIFASGTRSMIGPAAAPVDTASA